MHYGSRNICKTQFYHYIYHCILSLRKSRWVMWINPKDNPGDPEIANENISQWVITIEYVCACSHTSLNNKMMLLFHIKLCRGYRNCKSIDNGKTWKISHTKKLCHFRITRNITILIISELTMQLHIFLQQM